MKLIELAMMILAVASGAGKLSTRAALTEPIYTIGNLIPDFKMTEPTDQQQQQQLASCHTKLSSVLNAIKFASEHLIQMFQDVYECNFDINPANTKVAVCFIFGASEIWALHLANFWVFFQVRRLLWHEIVF
jgi:hypothetical protein